MSKKLISFALAVLFTVSMALVFPVTAGAVDAPLDPVIDYVKETVRVEAPAGVGIIMYALKSAPPGTTDPKLLGREKWSIARVVTVGTGDAARRIAEIDISRVIPKKPLKTEYFIAFMVQGQPATRKVIEIPARPQNRVPATATEPEINVGKFRNTAGIIFDFDDDYSKILNLTNADIIIQFGIDTSLAKLLKTNSVPLADGDGNNELLVPTDVLTRNLQFTAKIAAAEGRSFASQPVRMNLPAQPKAPNVKHTVTKNDITGGTLNLRAMKLNTDGTIKVGSPQVRLEGMEWMDIDVVGSKITLSSVLDQLGVTKTMLPADPASERVLYIRTGHTARTGASAVRQLPPIDLAQWNAAIVAGGGAETCPECLKAPCECPCEDCGKFPCVCCKCEIVCDTCGDCKDDPCDNCVDCKPCICGPGECKEDRCPECGDCLICGDCDCPDDSSDDPPDGP